MTIVLKCGCEVNDHGRFLLGELCTKMNCGECRTIQILHPFGPKRFADLLFGIDAKGEGER